MLDAIGTVLEENFALIYFPHGLFFFAVGVGILAQHRKSNPFGFANDLWIMGIFALLHAFSEWFDVLIALEVNSFTPETLFRLDLASGFVESLSYAVLFIFGLRLLSSGKSWRPVVIPGVLFAGWVATVAIGLGSDQDPIETLTVAQVLSHYVLLIPSGLVAAWALRRQADDEAASALPPRVRAAVIAMAWVFVFVALVNGLFVNRGPFFPANVINAEAFRAVTGVDVQWPKGLVGTALMLVTWYLLVQFNRETDRLMAQAEENAVRFSEREHIGQDLHDGVIQTLYATGMVLEATVRKLDDASPARDNIIASIKGVNRSIQDLRNYIAGLSSSESVQQPLQHQIDGMLADLHDSYGLATSLVYDVPATLALASDRRSNLYYVVAELLNNVGKHAIASRVDVEVTEFEDKVRITISDDGKQSAPVEFWEKGIAPASAGMGLRNIRDRIEELHGELWYSDAGDGNRVTLQVPKEMAVAA